MTISAAGDRISVSRIEQIEEAKLRWEEDAKRLRNLEHDMGLAAELGMPGFDDSSSQALALHDSEALQ